MNSIKIIDKLLIGLLAAVLVGCGLWPLAVVVLVMALFAKEAERTEHEIHVDRERMREQDDEDFHSRTGSYSHLRD